MPHHPSIYFADTSRTSHTRTPSMDEDGRTQAQSPPAKQAPALPQIGVQTTVQGPRGYAYSKDTLPRKARFDADAYVPQQDPKDPSRFVLPDVRNKTISAPLQPRITDVRAHVERDPSYSAPTFDIRITLKLKMQPGDLS